MIRYIKQYPDSLEKSEMNVLEMPLTINRHCYFFSMQAYPTFDKGKLLLNGNPAPKRILDQLNIAEARLRTAIKNLKTDDAMLDKLMQSAYYRVMEEQPIMVKNPTTGAWEESGRTKMRISTKRKAFAVDATEEIGTKDLKELAEEE